MLPRECIPVHTLFSPVSSNTYILSCPFFHNVPWTLGKVIWCPICGQVLNRQRSFYEFLKSPWPQQHYPMLVTAASTLVPRALRIIAATCSLSTIFSVCFLKLFILYVFCLHVWLCMCMPFRNVRSTRTRVLGNCKTLNMDAKNQIQNLCNSNMLS